MRRSKVHTALDESQGAGPPDSLVTPGGGQLTQDVSHMGLDRIDRDVHARSYLLGWQHRSHACQDLYFSFAQRFYQDHVTSRRSPDARQLTNRMPEAAE